MRKAKTLPSRKDIADFVTLDSLLTHVPISARTMHRYIADGKLRAYKLDGKLIFNTADVEAFLKRRSVGGGPTAPIVKERLAPAAAPAESRVLSDGEAKAFFDNLPVFVRPDWKPPRGLLEFD
jgi:hypothetical protein